MKFCLDTIIIPPDNDNEIKNAVSKIIQVKVLVFPNEWENMKKLDQPNRHLTKSNKKAKHVDEWA